MIKTQQMIITGPSPIGDQRLLYHAALGHFSHCQSTSEQEYNAVRKNLRFGKPVSNDYDNCAAGKIVLFYFIFKLVTQDLAKYVGSSRVLIADVVINLISIDKE